MNAIEIMIPMRTGAQQFAAAAANSCLLRIFAETGLHEVDGVGGKCLMEPAEYERYKRLCATWAEAAKDEQDAPRISMLEATAEEEAEFSEMLEAAADASFAEATEHKPRSHFAASFREIELLLLSYNHTLSEEERDDMMLTLCAKILPLRVAVLRAEEIWSEQTLDSDSAHRADLEKLACINENESLRLEIEQLKIDHDYEAERANEAQSKVNHLVEELLNERASKERVLKRAEAIRCDLVNVTKERDLLKQIIKINGISERPKDRTTSTEGGQA